MRDSRRIGPWAVGIALALVPIAGAAEDRGVCVAVSGEEHVAVAGAARRALGVPSERVDVRERRGLEALAARCGRLVVAVGPGAARAAAEVAPAAPVVHAMVPESSGPRGPGVATGPDPRRVLETLLAMAPRARRVGAVYDPDQTAGMIDGARAAARELGVEIVALPVSSAGEAVRAFRRFERELAVDALWLLPDGTATVQETVYYALEIAHWRRMAVIGISRWYVASGALFAMLPAPEAIGTAAGELGRALLRGDAPPSLVYAEKAELYVNERTASRLGLSVPRRLLESAEQVLP